MILPLGTYTYDCTLGTFWSQRDCQCIYSFMGFFSHIFYLISLESMENFESLITFCKEIHIFPINSVYSEHCTSWVQFLDDSFCTGRKKKKRLFPAFSFIYKSLSGLSLLYLCFRLKNARYIVITHTKPVFLFWSSFLFCSSSCPVLLYLLLRWTI